MVLNAWRCKILTYKFQVGPPRPGIPWSKAITWNGCPVANVSYPTAP
jgi:hypothetical protein